MAVYYFEGEQIVTPFTIASNEPMYDVDTISLKKQRASQGVQRWELSFSVVSENPADLLVNTISSFDSVNTMVMPQLNKVEERFSKAGTVTVANNQIKGANTVEFSRTNVFGIIPKGYFIKFSNTDHNKVYMVLNDVELLGLGTATCNIYPSLHADVSAGTTVYTGQQVKISYYRDISDIKGITYSDGVLSNPGTINIIEAV